MRLALAPYLASMAIACSHPAPPAPPQPARAAASFAVPAELANQLASGFSVPLELRTGDTAVGSCRVMFDLWDEVFVVVARGKVRAHTADEAVAACLDLAMFDRARDAARAAGRPFSGVVVPHVVEPIAAPAPARSAIWCGLTTELWRDPLEPLVPLVGSGAAGR